MVTSVAFAIACQQPSRDGPFIPLGTCPKWEPFAARPAPPLELPPVLLPIGTAVTRSVSLVAVPCSDPSGVSVQVGQSRATARVIQVGVEDAGTMSAEVELSATEPGAIDVTVNFVQDVVRTRFYAVEERPRLVEDPQAVFVSVDGTVHFGRQRIGQVPPRAFSVGPVVWSHSDFLESWVVTPDAGLASRGFTQLDGTWSISSATESVIVAVRPGEAVEVSYVDGGYVDSPIMVAAQAQDPIARVNGRWLTYRQAVPTSLTFSSGFTGGRVCEFDGGCTSGSLFLTELRRDGVVAMPPGLDRFLLLDGPGPPRAEIEIPAGAFLPLLSPTSGVEGTVTIVVTNGFVLTPTFDGAPRLLAYPVPVPTTLVVPTINRDWFVHQGVGYRR